MHGWNIEIHIFMVRLDFIMTNRENLVQIRFFIQMLMQVLLFADKNRERDFTGALRMKWLNVLNILPCHGLWPVWLNLDNFAYCESARKY